MFTILHPLRRLLSIVWVRNDDLHIVIGSASEYAGTFDYTDIAVVPNTYSDVYSLHETFPQSVVRVVNPAPSVIHFDNKTKQITTFGDLQNRTVSFELYMDGLADPLLINFFPAPVPTQHGARTCILKELPDIHAVDPGLFRSDTIDFCYHTTSFSFTHEDPRVSSTRYVSTSALLPISVSGIYSLTLVSNCPVRLFLDHYTRPLIIDDGLGSFSHVITLKLAAARHRLVAYAYARESESFALYLHSVRRDVPQRLLADEDLLLPAATESLDVAFLQHLSLWSRVEFSHAFATAVRGEVAFRSGVEDAAVTVSSESLQIRPRGPSVTLQLEAASTAGVFRMPARREVAVREPCEGIEATLWGCGCVFIVEWSRERCCIGR